MKRKRKIYGQLYCGRWSMMLVKDYFFGVIQYNIRGSHMVSHEVSKGNVHYGGSNCGQPSLLHFDGDVSNLLKTNELLYAFNY